MTLKPPRIKALFLIVAVSFFLAVNFGTSAQPERSQRVAATPTPASSPTPTPFPTPAVRVQTLTELQSKVRSALLRAELRRGSVGVKIVSLNTGKVVYEENADKYFMPASNMKNFTVAAAMEKLSPDFRFVTSVLAAAKPEADGTLRGGLTVYGRGDVSISTAFYDGDHYRGLEALADKIVQAGVKRIEGDLVGDESYFSGGAIPASWEWDDLQWYWGAEISALPINDNAVDLSVSPGSASMERCAVQILPINIVVKIVNNCFTGQAGAARDLKVEKKLAQNIIEVSGTMPRNDPGYKTYITVSHPAELFMALLRQVLEKRGVTVTGQTRMLTQTEKAMLSVAPVSSGPRTSPVEIARLESPPFSVVAAKTMKPSQNMYTETILWTLGEQVGDKSNRKATSAERGLAVVRSFLKQVGIPDGSVLQHDGSGLSRHNLITPNAVTTLYAYMAKGRNSAVWRDSLTIGGVDGTLRNRFKGTAAAGNIRGKTGTIDQVSALSGYVTTAGSEQLVVSIIVNGVEVSAVRTAVADEIVVSLANFNGRID